MFYRCIPEFVTLDPDLHPFASHLFACIAHKAYLDTGRVQMSIDYLAQISRLSERTILRYLPELEAKGYLKIHRAPKGSKIPNIYEITGLAAEVVIRKSKVEVTPATPERPLWQNPRHKGAAQTPMTERRSAFLNRPYPGKVVAEDRPPDAPQASEAAPAAQTAATASPDAPPTANESAPTADIRPTVSPQTPENCQENAPTTRSVAVETTGTSTESAEGMSEGQTTKQQETQTNDPRVEYVVEANSTPLLKLEGMAPEVMQRLIQRFGAARVGEVLQAARNRRYMIANPPGWVIQALEEGWEFGHRAHKNREKDPNRYLRGQYAEYINH
jgi:hypothetical protein